MQNKNRRVVWPLNAFAVVYISCSFSPPGSANAASASTNDEEKTTFSDNSDERVAQVKRAKKVDSNKAAKKTTKSSAAEKDAGAENGNIEKDGGEKEAGESNTAGNAAESPVPAASAVAPEDSASPKESVSDTAASDTTVSPKAPGANNKDPQATESPAVEGTEIGFFEKYFPFTFTDPLEPVVEEKWYLFILGAFLPLGEVWLPPLAMASKFPEGFVVEGIKIVLVHLAIHAAAAACLPLGLCGIVCGPGVIVTMGLAALINLINVISFVPNLYYLTPVAVANQYNRMVKEQGLPNADAPAAPPKTSSLSSSTSMAF